MFVLIVAGIVGFGIGRAISLIVSQLFQQHVSLNIPSARTLIVLGSGGKKFVQFIRDSDFTINFLLFFLFQDTQQKCWRL